MSTDIPTGVRLASTCLAVGGVLLFLLSPGMIITGSFVGFHILFPGILMLGLGILGMSASSRIDNRRPFSRAIGLVWGGTVAAVTSATMFAALREPEFDISALIIPGVFAVLSVCVVMGLLLPTTSRWLAAAKEPVDGSGSSVQVGQAEPDVQ